MQSLFSKLASLGVLALGLALVPATLPAQTSSAAGNGQPAATAPANQNGSAANTANDQNGNAVNPNNNPNQASTPPAGSATANNGSANNSGGGGWGMWGLLGLLGLFGWARGRSRVSYAEGRDRDRDINDRRVA